MIRVDLDSLNMRLEQDADTLERAARPAAQAGAQVLYIEARRNAMAIRRKTGNLASSIYQAYSERNSGAGHAVYHVSWNAKRARHGHLIEWGHIQRYVTYVGSDGNFYTAIRPSMRGKPRPKRRASQAIKDAYYVTLPTPKQVAAIPFMRRAAAKGAEAEGAMVAEIMRMLNDT